MKPATDSRWDTKLGKWVAKYTVPKLIEEYRSRGFSVTASAVYLWIRGTTVPRPDKATVIVELSGGELSLADVYSHKLGIGR